MEHFEKKPLVERGEMNLDTGLMDGSGEFYASGERVRSQVLHPFVVLMICLGLFIVFNFVAAGVMMLAARLNGIPPLSLIEKLGRGEVVGSRNFMRLVLFISHFFNFIVPGLITSVVVYKQGYLKSLRMDVRPKWFYLGMAVVLLLVSTPLVQYVYALNMKLHLPQWMMNLEGKTDDLLKVILAKEHWWEIVLNLGLIALLPAISEEIMFRGIVQQQLGRLIANPHVNILVSGAIFSAIHLQFQGFFPRMLLGMVLGYLFYWSKSLWVSSLAHFTNNAMTLVVFYASGGNVDEVGKVTDSAGLSALFPALISLGLSLCVGWYISNYKENLKVENIC
jgi:uncharacterized protein